MLGLRADATGNRLELIRPNLPEWLGKITITGLPVGDHTVEKPAAGSKAVPEFIQKPQPLPPNN